MTQDTPLNVLVAGGAGYIGSVTTAVLIEHGHRVTVLDNLVTGHKEAINPDARFVKGSIEDSSLVREVCRDGFDVVMHFAAHIEVGESVENPAKYYTNNLVRSIAFFDALIDAGVKRLVFSSTAAVYGEPEHIPLTEDSALRPVNPYGFTKLAVEHVMRDYEIPYGFKTAALRYFNAGGAVGRYGEAHNPESHIIPRILNAVLRGDTLKVFGTDYDTRDGSCVRDYIHVRDLAEAHILAARYLIDGGSSDRFNLGSGAGYTVLEVIEAVRKVTGQPVKYDLAARRPGDSASLVASPAKAIEILGWRGNPASLEDIIQSAWEWKRQFPNGYGDMT